MLACLIVARHRKWRGASVTRSRAAVLGQSPDAISGKACNFKSFPSEKQASWFQPDYRRNRHQGQVVLIKYVQAGGLFIFGFSHAKTTADPDWK